MKIKQLINRAYMQIGDTSHVNYTPYEFLEYYNEGNHILHWLISKYIPSMIAITETTTTDSPQISTGKPISRIVSLTVGKNESDAYTHGYEANTLHIDEDIKPGTVITVEYVPTAGYKELDDESGYPAEIESMLVHYMVTKILKGDISFIGNWEDIIADMGTNYDGNGTGGMAFIGRGYWDNDSSRTDYTD